MVASDVADDSISAVHLVQKGKEEYGNMWQKTRAIMKRLYEHREDYDWFYLCGDDVYVIVENLLAYLASDELAKAIGGNATGDVPVMLGHMVRLRHPRIVTVVGGGGYLLNRAGLDLFMRKAYSSCRVHERNSMEDRFMTWCMQENGAKIFSTLDSKGLTRFGWFSPADYANPRTRLVREAPPCCSQGLISLHYMPPEDIYWFDKYLYRSQPCT